MDKVLISFCNGEQLVLCADEICIGITSNQDDNGIYSRIDKVFELCPHHNHGLIPAVMDMIYSCDYFLNNKESKVYSTKHIVSIEKLSN